MPENCFEVLDNRFRRLHNPTARLDVLYAGCRWAEGPAYFPAGRYLIWSDNPNNRMLRYDECTGTVSVFRHPSNFSNGNTVDRSGRLVTCEHGGRRVSRTEFDGTVTAIADSYRGKRLNSPNDVVVKSDGSIWFTDPTYGIDSDYEGYKSPIRAGRQFRLPGRSRTAARCASSPTTSSSRTALPSRPTRRRSISSTPAPPMSRRARAISANSPWATNGRLTDRGVFAECTAGLFDGFRLDTEGRIWTSAGDGVHCYEPDGTLIGKIKVPEVVANVCFGGPQAQLSLYLRNDLALRRQAAGQRPEDLLTTGTDRRAAHSSFCSRP